MSRTSSQEPQLLQFYKQYLLDENSAVFIRSVALAYTVPTLERMVLNGVRLVRRAAALSLAYLGEYDSCPTLSAALVDDDRGVRILADHGVRELWRRDGTDAQQQEMTIVLRFNANNMTDEAIAHATSLIQDAPTFAEAWNQRAIAFFAQGRFDDAAGDCEEALYLNEDHFGAAVGLGHCLLEEDDPSASLTYFQRALEINPNLEGVRAKITRLQRALDRQ